MAGNIFVGREPELQALEQFLGRPASSTSPIVFITGEAGAGKSALIAEFVRRAEAADPQVVAATGECNAQTGAGDAYLPFRQVLTSLSSAGDGKETGSAGAATNAARLKDLARVSGETLLDVAPDLIGIFVPGATLIARLASSAASHSIRRSKPAVPTGKAHQGAAGAAPNRQLDQEKMFEQYARVLQALAQKHTLILILDDLQWADTASLNLLFYLARQLKERRVLLVGTYRPDDVALGRGGERHPLEPILNELKRYYGDIVIDLGAAQAAEGRAFVDALMDSEPNRLDAVFRNELFVRTEGHPLFTVELLRSLQERGDLVQDAEGKWIQAASLDWNALPARVEGVIEERIARLADDLRETLNIGSVVGYEFAAQVVARVQQVGERELLKTLTQELEKRHRLVLEEGENRIGSQFLTRYRFIHAVFQQFLYDGLGAGERRMLHGEVAEALEQLYADHTDEIAVELARHFTEAGDDAKAFQYSATAGDRAMAVYSYAEARTHYAAALQALARLPDTPANKHGFVETTLKQVTVSLRSDGPAVSLARLQKAEALLRQVMDGANPASTDRLLLARINYWSCHNLMLMNRRQEALAKMRQVLPLAEELHADELHAAASSVIGRMLATQGHYAEAVAQLAEVIPLLEKFSSWQEWIMAVGYRASAVAARGDWQQALVDANRIVAQATEMRNPTGLTNANLLLSTTQYYAGDLAGMTRACQVAVDTAEKTGDRLLISNAYAVVARPENELGNHARALQLLDAAQQIAGEMGGLMLADWNAATRCEIALAKGNLDQACQLAAAAVEYARTCDGIFAEGRAQRVWAQALAAQGPSNDAQAEAHFAESLRVFELGDGRLEAARTQAAWGKMYRDRGNLAAAREHFEKAIATFQACDLERDLKETQALLS